MPGKKNLGFLRFFDMLFDHWKLRSKWHVCRYCTIFKFLYFLLLDTYLVLYTVLIWVSLMMNVCQSQNGLGNVNEDMRNT